MLTYELTDFLKLEDFINFKKQHAKLDRNFSAQLISECRTPFSYSVVQIDYQGKKFAEYNYDVYGDTNLIFKNYITINKANLFTYSNGDDDKMTLRFKSDENIFYILNYLHLVVSPKIFVKDDGRFTPSLNHYMGSVIVAAEWSDQELQMLEKIKNKFSAEFVEKLKESLKFVEKNMRTEVLNLTLNPKKDENDR